MPTAPIIDNRRNRPERRSNEVVSQFPVITAQGNCIRKDRRSIPERRISNIVVKEWEVKASIFDTLFSKHTSQQNKK
ncbi:MAG: hypothetical protein ACRBDX_02950 [Gammaproteobacteria bacterium]